MALGMLTVYQIFYFMCAFSIKTHIEISAINV